jgi:peptide/nickel transport system ATP-binding protein
MSQSSLISIENLSVEFETGQGTVRAVDGISLELKPGSTMGIVGESGSGKSVTALSVMGLIPSPPGRIRSGKISFGPHEDLVRLSDREMRHIRGKDIGMIFQEPMSSLNPVFTCGSQVTETIRQHKDVSKKTARELCLELFREVKLPRPDDILRSYPHQLSGGQKQRVMIAMAISCQPKLLIADEPTTALDVTVQKEILRLLLDLQQAHSMSIMFITHDLGVVNDIAETVAVMYKGKIVERGPVSRVFHHPEHAYTKGLLACRPPLDKRPPKLLTVHDFMNGENVASLMPSDSLVNNYSKERARLHEEMYSGKPILSVENLSTWFPLKRNILGKPSGYVKAVNDVSLSVYQGETLGLVGESGCGKTTLGRTIIKLVDQHSGQIRFREHNISHLKGERLRNIRKRIQIVFQDPYSSLNPRLTIGSAIEEPMIVHGIRKSKTERKALVSELLEQVGLDATYAYRYPHELSGGQRQRACIARALAVDPEFIVCDESVSALDVSVQAQVLNLLNRLKRERNLTYIFISHDLSVVKYMSDRMAVMENGKIVEIGDADQVYARPEKEYTRMLIRAIPGTGKT